ncbi:MULTISPECIES: hypothetical protein [Streptomyces]|uniref:SLAC1 family transporter n=1 Tax=Streptomyces TaxID=1883 RepID=UPI002F95F1BD
MRGAGGTRSRRGRPWPADLPPAAGAAVLAPAVLSAGLELLGHEALSLAFFAVASALYLVLAYDFAVRLVRDRGRFRTEAHTPSALTAVAATTVLGCRLSLMDRQAAAAVLLALAALLWPGLLIAVERHWKHRMPGGAFLVCVATQGLAVLSAMLADAWLLDWLARAALAAFCLGILLYAQALARFDLREVLRGAGDHWVAGGALAISALAASRLAASPAWTGGPHSALRWTTLALLALSLAWYAVLLGAELRAWRPRYDIRRWATVFPLGMTAAACLSAAGATGVAGLRPLGAVLLWIAVGAWLLTCAALASAGLRRRPGGAAGGPPVSGRPGSGRPTRH